MTTLIDELNEFKFEKKGSIIISECNAHPHFDLLDKKENFEGNVYLWILEENNIPVKILYIGKAGKTLLTRFNQHCGGFKGSSKKGKQNSLNLSNLLKDGQKIGVYARHSERLTILGQENISLCDAEETALISYYKNIYPLFNKA